MLLNTEPHQSILTPLVTKEHVFGCILVIRRDGKKVSSLIITKNKKEKIERVTACINITVLNVLQPLHYEEDTRRSAHLRRVIFVKYF